MDKMQFPSTVENVRPLKDGSMSITFHTSEMPNPEKLILLNLLGKYGWLLFKPDTEWDISDVPKDNSGYDDGASPQKRLRGVIFKYWETSKREQHPDFETYYRRQIEFLINQYKEKII